MNKTELKIGYSIFGNKGNVWNNGCHISKDNDRTGQTLCGVPMLSSNWARIEGTETIGCKECLAIYAGQQEVINDYYADQLNLVQPAVNTEHGLQVKFTSSLAETKYMALNDESASAIVEFLSNNFTLTLK